VAFGGGQEDGVLGHGGLSLDDGHFWVLFEGGQLAA
jgi:hypothetical protein